MSHVSWSPVWSVRAARMYLLLIACVHNLLTLRDKPRPSKTATFTTCTLDRLTVDMPASKLDVDERKWPNVDSEASVLCALTARSAVMSSPLESVTGNSF